jgi:hypothetical protein
MTQEINGYAEIHRKSGAIKLAKLFMICSNSPMADASLPNADLSERRPGKHSPDSGTENIRFYPGIYELITAWKSGGPKVPGCFVRYASSAS